MISPHDAATFDSALRRLLPTRFIRQYDASAIMI